jgi:formylmethanofuran dehydrogenase subunit E
MSTKEELEIIADEIIGYSDGSFNIEWGEEYTALSLEEQNQVDEMVFEVIDNCDACGWYFIWDSMETHSDGECYCWRCYEDKLEENEEDEDNED